VRPVGHWDGSLVTWVWAGGSGSGVRRRFVELLPQKRRDGT